MSGILRSWGSHEGGNIVSSAARPLAAVTLSFAQLLNAAGQEPSEETNKMTPESIVDTFSPDLISDEFSKRQKATQQLLEALFQTEDPRALLQRIKRVSTIEGGKPVEKNRMEHFEEVTRTLSSKPSVITIERGTGTEISNEISSQTGFHVRPACEKTAERLGNTIVDLPFHPSAAAALVKLGNATGTVPRTEISTIVMEPGTGKESQYSVDDRFFVAKETEGEHTFYRLSYDPRKGAILTFPWGDCNDDSDGLPDLEHGLVHVKLPDGRMKAWKTKPQQFCPPLYEWSFDTRDVEVMTATVPETKPVPTNGRSVSIGNQRISVFSVGEEQNGWREVVISIRADQTVELEKHQACTYFWQNTAADRWSAMDANGEPLPTKIVTLERQDQGTCIGLLIHGKPKTIDATVFTDIKREKLTLP